MNDLEKARAEVARLEKIEAIERDEQHKATVAAKIESFTNAGRKRALTGSEIKFLSVYHDDPTVAFSYLVDAVFDKSRKIEERLAALEAGQDGTKPIFTSSPVYSPSANVFPKTKDRKLDTDRASRDQLMRDVETLRDTIAIIESRVDGLDASNLDKVRGQAWVLAKRYK